MNEKSKKTGWKIKPTSEDPKQKKKPNFPLQYSIKKQDIRQYLEIDATAPLLTKQKDQTF